MKFKMHGPLAGVGPHGMIQSWGPGEVVDVDESDDALVAFYRAKVDAGAATLLDEPAVAKTEPSPAVKAEPSQPAPAAGKSTEASKR